MKECADMFLYILECNSKYKIGITSNDVTKRIAQLQTGNSNRIVEICRICTNNAEYVEKYWHTIYSEKRGIGEWFTLTEDDINNIIRTTPTMYLPSYSVVSDVLLDMLCECSKPAQQVFKKLKQCKTEIVVIPRKTLTRAEEKQFDKGITELLKLDIVTRVKPEHYKINTQMFKQINDKESK